jgi:hypothetical protein
MGYQSADSVPDDGMIIESDEGWGMEVGPLFGCVNGEPVGIYKLESEGKLEVSQKLVERKGSDEIE